MIEQNNKRLYLVIGLSVLVFILFALYIVRLQIYSAKVNIVVTPSESSVTINGKPTKAGTYRVKPGSYVVRASLSGFTSSSVTVKAIKNQTVGAGVALTSNSSSTSNWYFTHPKDEQISEGISSHSNDVLSQQALQKVPLISLLPFTGPNFDYQINYGNQNGANAGTPIIYISASTTSGYQEALTWIKAQGYDPSKLDIQQSTPIPTPAASSTPQVEGVP
jgi:hypothetical protein